MDNLEKYICDHKSLFDEEPAAGHFERLQEKINHNNVKIIPLRWSISIAATIAILLSAGIVWQKSVKQNELTSCENASDMKICYLEKMNTVAAHIEELIKDFDQWNRQDVLNDVQDIIDTVNDDFESEIPEELPDDMVKAILSDYYQRNLEGLEMIVESILNL